MIKVKSKVNGFCAGFFLKIGQEIEITEDALKALGDQVEVVGKTKQLDQPVKDKMIKKAVVNK